MNIKTKLVLSAALVALLSAPASARYDSDESRLSAYPSFAKEHTQMTSSGFAGWRTHFINRPRQQR